MPKTNADILFFIGDIRFTLRNKKAVGKWLQSVSRKHKKHIASLNYVFVSDDYLLDINKRFLRHNFLTDIISFDYSADKKAKNGVVGEIYISIPRVYENAAKFKSTKTDELHRVMAHGLLHLCGFQDKSPRDIKRMRTEEENALDLRQF